MLRVNSVHGQHLHVDVAETVDHPSSLVTIEGAPGSESEAMRQRSAELNRTMSLAAMQILGHREHG